MEVAHDVDHVGSALQLTPHVHASLPDGLWVPGPGPGDVLTFVELAPPTDADVAELTYKIARRLTKVAQRYLAEREREWSGYDPDDEAAARDHCLGLALRAPVRPSSTLPLGERGEGCEPFGAGAGRGPTRKPLCAQVSGFSLHAATRVEAHDRDGLERLLRYGLRAPLSAKRLSLLPDGRVRYELRRPWPTPSGVTELVFEPLPLMRRLAALIPAPYTNMVRYYGAFANRSKHRPRLPQTPEARRLAAAAQTAGHRADADADADVDADADADADEGSAQLALPLADTASDAEPEPKPALDRFTAPRPRSRRSSSAVLLHRACGIEALRCECGAAMTVLALITDGRSLERILTHLGLPTHPPPIAPARLEDPPGLGLDLGLDLDGPDDVCQDHGPSTAALAAARGPP